MLFLLSVFTLEYAGHFSWLLHEVNEAPTKATATIDNKNFFIRKLDYVS